MNTYQKRTNLCCKLKWRIFCTAIMMIVLMTFSSLAQNQGKIWYFGEHAGLSFNTNPPSALTGGQLVSLEGSAIICDDSGNLLFYTDGVSVWNRSHTVMPNGSGLLGNQSTAQSALIVPDPGSSNKYYVFTVSNFDSSNRSHIYYSKIDMTLNGGMGDVETNGKNSVLLPYSEESVTAVPGSAANCWWIIAHKRGTSNFYAFRITTAGIDVGNPVISTVGRATPSAGVIGKIKANGAGNRLAMTTYYGNYTEVYDFNNATGLISNPIFLSQYRTLGVEFSPNGNLLYVCGHNRDIVQYNLLAGSPSRISRTRYEVNPSAYGRVALQVAPDGKIYGSVEWSTALDVISNPNVIGAGCGYVPRSQPIGGRCMRGLPNFIASYVSIDDGIKVTSPNGGEEWDLGAVENITWKTTGTMGDLKISLWKGGQLVGNIADNIDPASKSYAWQVGQYNGGTVQEGTGYTIEIEEIGSDLLDGSDDPFSIIVLNEAPVAVCKNIEIPVDSNCQATITADDVDGGSYDPDEDDEITLSLDNSGPFGVGQYNVKLTVEDLEGESDYCYATVTVVDNTPPVPDMAELPVVSGECSATITVFPTASDNCAGIIQGITTDPLSYTGQGTYTVTWIFDDGRGNTATQTQTVVVQDTTAPTIANIASSHVLLWPPNHQMVPVTLTVDAADNCDAAPVSRITKVESSEPVEGLGDGNTSPDWEITGDLTVNLRAERSGRGKGIGRIYTITIECSDAVGNVSSGTVTVIVPKNKKKK